MTWTFSSFWQLCLFCFLDGFGKGKHSKLAQHSHNTPSVPILTFNDGHFDKILAVKLTRKKQIKIRKTIPKTRRITEIKSNSHVFWSADTGRRMFLPSERTYVVQRECIFKTTHVHTVPWVPCVLSETFKRSMYPSQNGCSGRILFESSLEWEVFAAKQLAFLFWSICKQFWKRRM